MKINEVCHFIISFCQGKVKGSSPAEAKFPARWLPRREQTHCARHREAPSAQRRPFLPTRDGRRHRRPAPGCLAAPGHTALARQSAHRPAPHAQTVRIAAAKPKRVQTKGKERRDTKKFHVSAIHPTIAGVRERLCKVSPYRSRCTSSLALSSLLSVENRTFSQSKEE